MHAHSNPCGILDQHQILDLLQIIELHRTHSIHATHVLMRPQIHAIYEALFFYFLHNFIMLILSIDFILMLKFCDLIMITLAICVILTM